MTDGLGLEASGLFSQPVIATFVSTVGFTGMLVMGATDAGPGLATLAGVGTGAVGAVLAARVTKATPTSDHLPGLIGTVVTPIPVGGLGEVMLRVAGQPLKYTARSDEAIGAGVSVMVTAALSSTSVHVRQMPA